MTAVVVNWRTAQLAVRSVRSLADDGLAQEQVVLVDNASGGNDLAQLRHELPHARILPLEQNVGFARANNLGARALPPSRALLLVNSDAFVHKRGSIEHLVSALDDPAVGLAVPRLRNPDLTLQPNVVPASTPLPELVRASGFSRLVPNRLQPLLGTHWDHGYSRQIQAATGAVVLVRPSAWFELAGFDEREFMYAEDLDLFWRARRRGWRARFVAEAEFVHLGGAAASQLWDQSQRAERVARAEAEMVREHLGPVRARVTIGLMAGGVGVRALVHRSRGNRAAAAAQLGWWRGYLSSRDVPPAPRA